jgi:hypothetical protein
MSTVNLPLEALTVPSSPAETLSPRKFHNNSIPGAENAIAAVGNAVRLGAQEVLKDYPNITSIGGIYINNVHIYPNFPQASPNPSSSFSKTSVIAGLAIAAFGTLYYSGFFRPFYF